MTVIAANSEHKKPKYMPPPVVGFTWPAASPTTKILEAYVFFVVPRGIGLLTISPSSSSMRPFDLRFLRNDFKKNTEFLWVLSPMRNLFSFKGTIQANEWGATL